MPKLLLIDNRVRLTDLIISSIESDVDSIIFDYETETLDSLISKITVKPYDSIGIVQEQDTIPTYTLAKPMGDYDLNDYSTWTTYIDLVQWCVSNLGIKFWDLIECNIDSTWQTVISSLQDQFNITIRSSSKQLGNTDVGDNWTFDDGTSLIGLYFTSAINEYPYTLGAGYSLGTVYLIDKVGDVYGRGSNYYGQLGITPNNDPYPFTKIPLTLPAVQVSTTNTGVVFLLNDGTCYSCGYNYKFSLGLASVRDTLPTTFTSPNPYIGLSDVSSNFISNKIDIADVKYITCGLYHTIFLLRDGSVTVTGTSSTGATCYGISTPNLTYRLKPNVLQDVYLISTMYEQTMVVYANKQNYIYFFGNNTTSEPSVICYRKFLLKESTLDIKQIESGGRNMYYVDVSNNLYGIGKNNVGQLGRGNTIDSASWVDISMAGVKNTTTTLFEYSDRLRNNVLKVTSSGPNITILTLTGQVFFSGLSSGQQLTLAELPSPWGTPGTTANMIDNYTTRCINIASGTDIYDIFSYLLTASDQKFSNNVAVTEISVFYVKGTYLESSGKAEVASLTNRIIIPFAVNNEIVPLKRGINLINNSNEIYQVGFVYNTTTNVDISNSTFTNYSIGVTPKNVINTNVGLIVLTNTNVSATSLYSYGTNLYGELGSGIGTAAHTLTVPYTGLTLSVSAGLYHSLFLLSDGKVYATGLNNYGQLGLGDTTNRTTPTLGLTNITACFCGLYSSYFLSNTGVVSVCGYNFNSELGSGSDLLSSTFNYFYKTPVQLKGTHTLLACGYYHSIKKLSDGTISVAGSNTYGQLGLGNTSPYNGYQKLTCPDFTGLFAGENRSAGLTSDGTLYAWGRTIGTTPLLTDINVSSVYQVTDIGIIYIKNSRYYVAYANGLLAPYAYGPVPGITPSNINPLRIYSNICFLAGTPVKCDQGLIAIDKINPSIHTILGKKIVAITETHSTEKELVIIEKDSLRPNVPNQTTVITMEHKIFYKGKMTEAHKVSKKRMNYNNEKLYNVLMEEHNKMNVNNMIVETLDPTNMIGKVFKGLREMI